MKQLTTEDTEDTEDTEFSCLIGEVFVSAEFTTSARVYLVETGMDDVTIGSSGA